MGDEGDPLLKEEIYDQAFMRRGEPMKPITLGEAIKLDPDCMKLSSIIRVLRYCEAANSRAWTRLPAYKTSACPPLAVALYNAQRELKARINKLRSLKTLEHTEETEKVLLKRSYIEKIAVWESVNRTQSELPGDMVRAFDRLEADQALKIQQHNEDVAVEFIVEENEDDDEDELDEHRELVDREAGAWAIGNSDNEDDEDEDEYEEREDEDDNEDGQNEENDEDGQRSYKQTTSALPVASQVGGDRSERIVPERFGTATAIDVQPTVNTK